MTGPQRVSGEVIELDYKEFENIEFFQCKLVFKGGLPPRLKNVKFTESEFIFDGAARNTQDFLIMMISADPQFVFEELLGLKRDGPLNG